MDAAAVDRKRTSAGVLIAGLVLAAAVLLGGCPASQKKPPAPATDTSTSLAMPPKLPGPLPGQPFDTVTAAMLAGGDSVFHGLKGNGLCQTCHGPDANGTPIAPSLVRPRWLTGDGSYDFIQKRILEGMDPPTPPYKAPMPPMGNAPLSLDMVQEVAGYVYSISRNSDSVKARRTGPAVTSGAPRTPPPQ